MMRGSGRNMRRMMSRMGVNMKDVADAQEVIIRTETKEIVITKPTVQEMDTGENTIFMIMAVGYEEREREQVSFSEDDIEILCIKANVDKDKAVAALTESGGELGTALLKLQAG